MGQNNQFLILRNGTRMSATNQHSSKWYPRLKLQCLKSCLGIVLLIAQLITSLQQEDSPDNAKYCKPM